MLILHLLAELAPTLVATKASENVDATLKQAVLSNQVSAFRGAAPTHVRYNLSEALGFEYPDIPVRYSLGLGPALHD